MGRLDHRPTAGQMLAAPSWPLPKSMEAVLDLLPWPDLAATTCNEIAQDPSVTAMWAVRWASASNGTVIATAGSPEVLNAIDELHWPALHEGELLSLALSSPARHLPPQHVLLGLTHEAIDIQDLHNVLLIPMLENDDLPWTLILLLNQPLNNPHELAHRLQKLWDVQSRSQRHALIQRACESAGNSMFVTDAEGEIIWSNPAFSALTGYSTQQIKGQNPRILNSGRQSARYYRRLWQTIQAGGVWTADTIDKDRFGYLYTIRQTISPVMQDGEITHYLSVHDDISQRKSAEQQDDRERQIEPMSGLLNATAFLEALGSQLRLAEGSEQIFAVVSFSVSNFASVASTLALESRQRLMQEIGRRIKGQLNRNGCAAHMRNGDFGLILPGADHAEADRFVADLASTLNEPYTLLDASPFFVLSHGTAEFPADAREIHELWNLADGANGAPPDDARDATAS